LVQVEEGGRGKYESTDIKSQWYRHLSDIQQISSRSNRIIPFETLHPAKMVNFHFFPLATLATAVVASPVAKTPIEKDVDVSQVQFTYGFYNASAPLQKRDVPYQCVFDTVSAYHYYKITDGSKTGCIAVEFAVTTVCGNGPWDAKNIEDMEAVVAKQATKDSIAAATIVNNWSTGWIFPTSAVPDRDRFSSLWNLGMTVFQDKKYNNWYYRYDGNGITVDNFSFGC
jgi:hypothetical protein